MTVSKLRIGTAVLFVAAALAGATGAIDPTPAAEPPTPASAGRTGDEDEKNGPAGTLAPAGKNIVRNGGFEEGDAAPAHWSQGAEVDGVEYVWDRKAGQKGKASACLHKTAQRYFPIAQWYQDVDRTGDLPALRVAAQVKADGVAKAVIDVLFLDDSGEAVGHKWAAYIGAKEAGDPAATHDWKEYAGKVDIPAGTKKLRVGLQVYGPGKVWFDEVRAEYEK